MSLLLDALQRASKEREKAAAAALASESNAPMDTSASELTLESSPASAPPGQTALPALELEPVAPSLQTINSTTDAPLALPSAHEDVSVDIEPPAALPEQAQPVVEEVLPPDVHVEHVVAPDLEEPTPVAPEELEPTKKPSSTLSQATQPASIVETPAAVVTAQDDRKASSPSKTKLRSRARNVAIALGSTSVALAAGSFFFGFWDQWLGQSGTRYLATQPASSTRDRAVAALEPTPIASSPKASLLITAKPQRQPLPRTKSAAPSSSHESNAPNSAIPESSPSAHAVSVKRSEGGPPPLETGYAALTHGRLDEAAQAYRQALSINPDERDALLGLANIAHRQRRSDDARELYQRALRLDPDNSVAKAGLLAVIAESDARSAGGLARDLTERYPQSAAALATLGNILAREGSYGDAQQAFFKAVSLEPENALYAFNLAVALDRLHKNDLAANYYERAVALAEKSGSPDVVPRATATQRARQLRESRDNDQSGTSTP